MPREIISIVVLRKTSTPDGAGGYNSVEVPITGSPFSARIYRRLSRSSDFVTDMPGRTDADRKVVVSFIGVNIGIKINDIAVLPDSRRARVTRVRVYTHTLQCDVEVGIE